jgi:dynein intermediate chain 2
MSPPSARTTQVFRDPSPFKRCATSVSWIPQGNNKVAVSYSIMGFQATPEGMSNSSYVWNVDNPNFPEQELLPPSALCCLEYNLKDQNILAGGAYNGLIAWWDVRKGKNPVEASGIEKSHRDPVYHISWLPSKTGTEMASVSTDGQVLWWDTRSLSEPVETLLLTPKGGDGTQLYGGVSMDYGEAGGPAKFMVGTEQGCVMMCNRKAKNPQDRIGTSYTGHHGPVYSVQRNAFFPKFFMTVGECAHH